MLDVLLTQEEATRSFGDAYASATGNDDKRMEIAVNAQNKAQCLKLLDMLEDTRCIHGFYIIECDKCMAELRKELEGR